MEVDHEAMKRASATTPTQPNNDPASAPEMVTASTKPMMGYQSGAVPDQYESFPEVVPEGQPSSPYPPPASAVSPQSTGSYDRYQTVSPPPAQQSQPLMQNPYYQGPIPVESEKKGYYGPALGVSQPPTPYSNVNTLAPDASVSGSSQGKGGALPPPAAYPNPPAEKKILGMRKKVFWIVLVVVILVILGGAGGAAGAILSKKKNNNGGNTGNLNEESNPTNPVETNPTNTTNSDYTPFALTTGVRVMNLQYGDSEGSCDAPNSAGGNLVDCVQTSKYTVKIDGSVEEGYKLSSVDIQGDSFSDIDGIPPTTDDPNADGGVWVFTVKFKQDDPTLCQADRATRYVFTKDDDVFGVGEQITLTEDCELQVGGSFPKDTSCICLAVSQAVLDS